MLSRRRALQGGLAAVSALSLHGPLGALAQPVTPTRVRYVEVVRSILYTPAYAAIVKGFFEEVGIEVTLETGQGSDKTTAALISDRADIVLMGPESPIFVENSESPVKVSIFCGLTATDGYILVGREKVEIFDWAMLKGKELIGRAPGTTPLLYLEWAMRQEGVDPREVIFHNNLAVPARPGAWLAGQGDYAIFIEPEASQLEMDGKAYFLASVGQTVGMVDYTVFQATDDYIKDNPDVCQAWTNAIYKAQKWTATAPVPEIVEVQRQFFPGLSSEVLTAATERYRELKVWKETPLVEEAAIETFQDILVNGRVLDEADRVKYEEIVVTEFAENAIRNEGR